MYPENIPDDDPDAGVEHMFFPLRFTDYTSDDQVNTDHPDSQIICQERELDKARLNNFLNLVKDKGIPLDGSQLSFAWMKSEHPLDDHRTVSFEFSQEILQLSIVYGGPVVNCSLWCSSSLHNFGSPSRYIMNQCDV